MNEKNNIKNKKTWEHIVTAIAILIGFTLSANYAIAGIGNPFPDDVTNLTNSSYENNYINWTWSDPTNLDPSLLILSIYIDGQYIDTLPGGVQYYNETNLDPGTQHTIGIQTIDIRGYKTDGILINVTASTNSSGPNVPTPIPTDTPTPSPTPIPTDTPTPIPTNNTYYISPNGNDNGPGTQTQPFSTIQKGISVASDGDTVQVLPGTYYQTDITGKILINKSITVNGSGRSNTIIDGSQITQYSDGWKEGLVEITGNGVYFGGFTVQNVITSNGSSGAAGIVVTSDNNIIEKNLIQYAFDSGIKVYGSTTTSHHATNNTIRYNELYRDVWGGDRYAGNRQETLSLSMVDGFYVYYNYVHEMGLTNNGTNKVINGAEGIDVKDDFKNGVIHHNYVYKGMAVGIYVDNGNDVDVYDNIVDKVSSYSGTGNDTHGDGVDTGSEVNTTTNRINIRNNTIYNVGNGLTVCNYHKSSYPPGIVSNILLENNIAHIDDSSIIDEGDIQVNNCGDNLSNISVINNYAYDINIATGIMPNGETVNSVVATAGNDLNLTDIANQFNAVYYNLKDDILAHINSSNVNSFSFIALADTKDGGDITAAESQSIIRDGLSPNLIIFPGDLCPDTNCFATNWKYDIDGDITGNTSNGLFNITFATRGNHDTNISDWQSAFDFAGVAKSIGATNYIEQTKDMTYSFDYANSHFVGLDVPGSIGIITPEQISWLDNDLTMAESRGLIHTFLFWHGPIYYVDGHPSDIPSDLINVLNKHPIVSAGFFGHEHVVTYTHINDSRISALTHPFEEFVSAGAGADLYDTNVSRVDYCIGKSGSICPKLYGYMSVEVADKNFNVSFYNMNGTLDNILSFKK